ALQTYRDTLRHRPTHRRSRIPMDGLPPHSRRRSYAASWHCDCLSAAFRPRAHAQYGLHRAVDGVDDGTAHLGLEALGVVEAGVRCSTCAGSRRSTSQRPRLRIQADWLAGLLVLVAETDSPVPERLCEGIHLEHVTFAYPGTERLAEKTG